MVWDLLMKHIKRFLKRWNAWNFIKELMNFKIIIVQSKKKDIHNIYENLIKRDNIK